LRLSNTRVGLGDIHYGSEKILTTINQGIEHSDSAGRWQEKREIRDQKSEVRISNFEIRKWLLFPDSLNLNVLNGFP